MGCATSKVGPVEVGPAEDGPVVRLIKVDDLLNNAILLDEDLGLTSEDVLQQHWTAKKSIDGLFGPHSFKLVPWRQLKSTKYGVLTYSWGNREKRIWGATWANMIRALSDIRPTHLLDHRRKLGDAGGHRAHEGGVPGGALQAGHGENGAAASRGMECLGVEGDGDA